MEVLLSGLLTRTGGSIEEERVEDQGEAARGREDRETEEEEPVEIE